MGENPKNAQDTELEEARKSMGYRVDPDPTPEGEAVVEPAKEPEAPTPAPIVEPKPEVAEDKQPVVEPKRPNRPETFIPMPKYHAEKDEWKNTIAAKDAALAEAQRKIEELTALANQKDGAAKDEDIEAFIEKSGFDRETVDDLLALAEKRLSPKDVMTPEQRDAVAKATAIVKEAEIEAAFENEFKGVGEPAILKSFPKATPEQIAQAKEYLDQVAHTADNHDKPLNFLVFDHQEKLAEFFAEPAPEVPGQTKKTLEPSRTGHGKQTTLTAEDFKDGKTDFQLLGELDPAVRSEIVKNLDSKTYASYLQYAKDQAGGVEVMRNGKKIVLK